MKKLHRNALKAAVAIAILAVSGTVFASPVPANTMWVVDANGNLGTVNTATGAVHVIGKTGATMTDIAYSPSGQLYGIDFSNLYSINSVTGASTLIGSLSQGVGANALVFGGNMLYMMSGTSTDLYAVNTTTGAATSLGNTGFASGGDLAFNQGSFYLAGSNNDLVKIDLSNPANSSEVGPFGVSSVFGLATATDNVMYGVAGTNIYQVNTVTGALSDAVSFSDQGLGAANGEAFVGESALQTVPEPSSMGMLGLGTLLIGLFAGLRRRFT